MLPVTDIRAVMGPNRRDQIVLEWTAVGGAPSHDGSLATGYALASLRLNSSNLSNGTRGKALGSTITHGIICANARRSTASGTANIWNYGIGFRAGADFAKSVLTAAGRLEANHHIRSRAATNSDVSTVAVANNTWQRIAMVVKLHASAGYIRYYVDDLSTPIAEFAGDTITECGTSVFDEALIIGNLQGRISNVIAAATTDAQEAIDLLRCWHAGVWLQLPNGLGDIDDSSSGLYLDISVVPIDNSTVITLDSAGDETSVFVEAPPSSAGSVLAAAAWWSGARDPGGPNDVTLFTFDGANREESPTFSTPITATSGDWITQVAPDGTPLRLADAGSWQWAYRVGA